MNEFKAHLDRVIEEKGLRRPYTRFTHQYARDRAADGGSRRWDSLSLGEVDNAELLDINRKRTWLPVD